MTDDSRREFLLRFAGTALSVTAISGCEAKSEVPIEAQVSRPLGPLAVYGPPRADDLIPGQVKILFAPNSTDLTVQAMAILDDAAKWLRGSGDRFAIAEGNADQRGGRERNLALGQARADAVKGYLVTKGIAASRIETFSRGAERPADIRKTEEAWARNRRVELIFGRR